MERDWIKWNIFSSSLFLCNYLWFRFSVLINITFIFLSYNLIYVYRRISVLTQNSTNIQLPFAIRTGPTGNLNEIKQSSAAVLLIRDNDTISARSQTCALSPLFSFLDKNPKINMSEVIQGLSRCRAQFYYTVDDRINRRLTGHG